MGKLAKFTSRSLCCNALKRHCHSSICELISVTTFSVDVLLSMTSAVNCRYNDIRSLEISVSLFLQFFTTRISVLRQCRECQSFLFFLYSVNFILWNRHNDAELSLQQKPNCNLMSTGCSGKLKKNIATFFVKKNLQVQIHFASFTRIN